MGVTVNIMPNTLIRSTSPQWQKVEFLTKDIRALDKLLADNHDKPLQVEFKVRRQKRSLDANGYAWVLCDKIAQQIRSTKELVYKEAIRDAGVWSDVAVKRKELAAFITHWESQCIGYQTDVHDHELKDYNRVRIYLGSSKYNTKEMSRLIDWLIDEAKELGIETLTPRELAQIKNAWKAE